MHMKAVVQEADAYVKDAGKAKDVEYVTDDRIFSQHLPAHDELGMCRTSLVSPHRAASN